MRGNNYQKQCQNQYEQGVPPQLGQCNAIRVNPMKKDIDTDTKITWPGEYLTIVSVFFFFILLEHHEREFLGWI